MNRIPLDFHSPKKSPNSKIFIVNHPFIQILIQATYLGAIKVWPVFNSKNFNRYPKNRIFLLLFLILAEVRVKLFLHTFYWGLSLIFQSLNTFFEQRFPYIRFCTWWLILHSQSSIFRNWVFWLSFYSFIYQLTNKLVDLYLFIFMKAD